MFNLDCMTNAERTELADALATITRHGGNNPDADETATEILEAFTDLREYAFYSAAAHDDRASGNIERAQYCEKRCDSIYSQLPNWARW